MSAKSKHPPIGGLLLKPEAVTALEVLVRAVYAAGDAVPCRRDPEAWTGDNPEPGVREGAAHLCQRCPALAECDDYATTARERWGVWAGVDRTPAHKASDDAAGEDCSVAA